MPLELYPSVYLALGVALATWLLSLMFREYSWVDRIWSVVPPVYIATFAHQAQWTDLRLNVMTLLTTLWGIRLTFNYARKGGYAKGGEDYRWAILQTKMNRWQWHLFNFGFISGYQNFLLFLIAMPAYTAWQSQSPWNPLDTLATVLFSLLLVGEFIADQQQWNFHQAKKQRAMNETPEEKGFLDDGLWAYSRHPNFFCEQGQWWVIYLFAVAASGRWLDPTLLGPVLLTLLFHGSAQFTESITAAKYPAYAAYQRQVSRMIPLPRRRG